MAIALALAAVGLLAAVASLLALARARRATRELGDRVAREVEPYLRRKAAEAGLELSAPVWTSRHSPTERLDYSAELAGQLLDHERTVPAAASSTALAQTVPASAEMSIETTAPQSPKARKPD